MICSIVANVTSPTSGSIFGGAVTPASPSSGESIFGGSASFSSPQQQAGASVFGSNTFGGGGSGGFGAQTSNTTTSVFGGSFSQATTNPPAFRSIQAQGGQAATAFGSPVWRIFGKYPEFIKTLLSNRLNCFSFVIFSSVKPVRKHKLVLDHHRNNNKALGLV